jgi:hypothetical protein
MIFELQHWKKDGLHKNRMYWEKKISTNQFCSWQIIVYALGHQVVPNNFELFCLRFILVEDCIAPLDVPLHTRKKGSIKIGSITTKSTKNSIKMCSWNKGKKEGLHRTLSWQTPYTRTNQACAWCHHVAYNAPKNRSGKTLLACRETVNKLLASKFSKNAKL